MSPLFTNVNIRFNSKVDSSIQRLVIVFFLYGEMLLEPNCRLPSDCSLLLEGLCKIVHRLQMLMILLHRVKLESFSRMLLILLHRVKLESFSRMLLILFHRVKFESFFAGAADIIP